MFSQKSNVYFVFIALAVAGISGCGKDEEIAEIESVNEIADAPTAPTPQVPGGGNFGPGPTLPNLGNNNNPAPTPTPATNTGGTTVSVTNPTISRNTGGLAATIGSRTLVATVSPTGRSFTTLLSGTTTATLPSCRFTNSSCGTSTRARDFSDSMRKHCKLSYYAPAVGGYSAPVTIEFYSDCGTCREATLQDPINTISRATRGLTCTGNPILQQYAGWHSFIVETLGDSACRQNYESFTYTNCVR